MLFQKNKKKTGILFKIIKFIKCEIRKDFKIINELIHIFNMESKKINYFSEILHFLPYCHIAPGSLSVLL